MAVVESCGLLVGENKVLMLRGCFHPVGAEQTNKKYTDKLYSSELVHTT